MCCLLLGSQSSQVEGQFLTLQDVTVTSTRLTWSRRDAGVQSTGRELVLDRVLDGGGTGSSSQLSLNLLRSLDFLALDLLTQNLTVVGLEPLSERSSVDLDNSRLGQGVGSHQLVVGWVVDNTSDSGLSGHTLGSPREVTGLNSQSSELLVSTSGSHGVDSLGTDLGVGRLTTQLKLSLLSELGSFGTSSRTLVTRVSRNTHGELEVSMGTRRSRSETIHSMEYPLEWYFPGGRCFLGTYSLVTV